MILNALQTAHALHYGALSDEIAALLQDASVHVPQRMVLALPGGGHLFIMPAHDARIAITKLITLTPANAAPTNAARGLASIQGNVVVFDNTTDAQLAVLDGPTITARRTAAVSLLAAQRMAAVPAGALLIIGAGVISGQASVVDKVEDALPNCPLVAICTPANHIALTTAVGLYPQAFVSAVGAYKAHMSELAPSVVQHFSQHGRIVVATADAVHEAGDLMQAGIDIAQCATLQRIVQLSTPVSLP